MDELVAFLRARLDEDERHARLVAKEAAYDQEGMWDPEIDDPPSGEPSPEFLADLNSKRRIIDEVVPEIERMATQIDQEWGDGRGACDEESGQLLRLLALPYAGHQDYREEWEI